MSNNTINTIRRLLERLLAILVRPDFAHEVNGILQFQIHALPLLIREVFYLSNAFAYVSGLIVELGEVLVDFGVVPLSLYHGLADVLELLKFVLVLL